MSSPASEWINSDLQREKQHNHDNLATIIAYSQSYITDSWTQNYLSSDLLIVTVNKVLFFSCAHQVEPKNISNIVEQIKHKSGIARALRKCSKIIWDGCTMAQIIANHSSLHFRRWDKCMFKNFCKNLDRPTTNMCVQLQTDAYTHIFFEQLLDIGNGKMSLQRNTQCFIHKKLLNWENIKSNGYTKELFGS